MPYGWRPARRGYERGFTSAITPTGTGLLRSVRIQAPPGVCDPRQPATAWPAICAEQEDRWRTPAGGFEAERFDEDRGCSLRSKTIG